MNIGKFSIDNSIFASLLMVFVLIFGLVAATSLQKELFPSTDLNYITIQTVYPGASALDIEKVITSPIEDAIQGVDGIKTVTSSSFEGISSVMVEVKSEIKDMDKVYNDIKSAIDRITDLPDDVLKPMVVKFKLNVPVVTIALSSKTLDEKAVRDQARIIENRLKNMSGVDSIAKSGYREKEIWVEVDPNKMILYNIALSQVLNSIRARNINVPGGKVSDGSQDFLIKTSGEILKTGEINDIVLRANDAGNLTRIGNLAKVHDAFKKETVITKTLGRKSIDLTVLKQDKEDAMKLVSRVYKSMAEYKKDAPKGLEIDYVNDLTPRIKLQLDTLLKHGFIGIILVIIILLVFMNPTVSTLTALGIPFSILSALIVMMATGISINMISLFGMILVLGMIVDQGIIVAENSFRYIESGLAPREAVIKGTNEVIMPVISSVLTTIAAFFPLMLIPGITGKFIHYIPVIVIICLTASVVQAFLVLPSNLANALKPVRHDPNAVDKRPKNGFFKNNRIGRTIYGFFHKLFNPQNVQEAGWYKKLLVWYEKILEGSLVRRKLIVGLTFLAFLLAIVLGPLFMKIELFTSRGVTQFNVIMRTWDNASLEFTEKQVRQIEEAILELPKNELDNFTTMVGTDSIGFGFSSNSDSNLAIITVYLTDEKFRKRSADDIIQFLKKRTANVKNFQSIRFEKMRGGPQTGKPVNIEVRGEDYGRMLESAEIIRDKLKTIKGLYDVDLSYKPGKQELKVSLDERKAAMTGVSVAQVAMLIRTAFEGMKATSIRRDDEVVNIIVKFDESVAGSLDDLMKIYIPNMMGQMIPLQAIANITMDKSVKQSDHIDNHRVINVFSEVNTKITTSKKANIIAKRDLKYLRMKYPELDIRFTGEEQETNEAFASLVRSFLLALALIYIILAVSFGSFTQPIIIMITIPLGILGIILALAIHGMPLSFFGLLGIVALAGVIVHDGILLIDFINIERKKGAEIKDAIIIGAKKRLRPIILTAATAAIGLLPMAYSIGGADPMLQPLAIGFMWGLIFGTFLTLILIPLIYWIFEDIKGATKKGMDTVKNFRMKKRAI